VIVAAAERFGNPCGLCGLSQSAAKILRQIPVGTAEKTGNLPATLLTLVSMRGAIRFSWLVVI
jgi:hypothetical protein